MAAKVAFTPGSKTALTFLNQLLAARNVDPAAADAVFSQEGAGGGIGDGGHAFGPGQFNNAGGVWTGKYQGLTPEQINAQAWSKQGLTELANDVANVAAGLKGQQAITNIVSRFERPKDPSTEITNALAAFGAAPTAAATSSTVMVNSGSNTLPAAPKAPASNGSAALIASLLKSSNLLKVPAIPVQPTATLPNITLPTISAPTLTALPTASQVTLPSFSSPVVDPATAAAQTAQAATTSTAPTDIASLAQALHGAVNATTFR